MGTDLNDAAKYHSIYLDLALNGRQRSPRGMLTLELENYHTEFVPGQDFINFAARKLSLSYIKKELAWYLHGQRHDLSICDHAKIWQSCVTSGLLYSNYGWYLFRRHGLDQVIQTLEQDPDSRRGLVNIFNAYDHSFHTNNDVPCTCTLGFRIRDGKVNMTVHMRSQDAVFGLGNDLPFFQLCWEVVAVALGLPRGGYHHFVESFHTYERHFDLVEKIIAGDEFTQLTRPELTSGDVNHILECLPLQPGDSPFADWLFNAS